MQKRKVLSLEWKSEGVMDDESGESMEETYFVWRLDVEKTEANFSPVFRAGSSHRPSIAFSAARAKQS